MTGCNTTSAILKKGQIKVLQLFEKRCDLRWVITEKVNLFLHFITLHTILCITALLGRLM